MNSTANSISTVRKNITVVNIKDKSEERIVIGNNSYSKKFATTTNPTIEAAITGLFRFDKPEKASLKIQAIRDHFVISSKLQTSNMNEVKLWIRGYELTPEEEKQGYLGNYAAIKLKTLDNGLFTLVAEKQRINLKFHPQRVREKRKHPDWGHPALRTVRKKSIFKTIDEAQKILEQLHTEYPDVSIPNPGKLYIIIYSKALNMRPPVQKFILEIKTNQEGGFYIDYKANAYNKKEPTKVEEAVKEPAGYFTSKVALQKVKKNSRKPKKKEDE